MLCQGEACKELAVCLADQVATYINLQWQTAHGANGTNTRSFKHLGLKQNKAVRSFLSQMSEVC